MIVKITIDEGKIRKITCDYKTGNNNNDDNNNDNYNRKEKLIEKKAE